MSYKAFVKSKIFFEEFESHKLGHLLKLIKNQPDRISLKDIEIFKEINRNSKLYKHIEEYHNINESSKFTKLSVNKAFTKISQMKNQNEKSNESWERY